MVTSPVASLITMGQNNYGLLFERHNKCKSGMKGNSGIHGHCWIVIEVIVCEPAMTLVASVLQPHLWFPLLQKCVLTISQFHVSCVVPTKSKTDMGRSMVCPLQFFSFLCSTPKMSHMKQFC